MGLHGSREFKTEKEGDSVNLNNINYHYGNVFDIYDYDHSEPSIDNGYTVSDGETICVYYVANAEYSNATQITTTKMSKSNIINGINRGLPNQKGNAYREPALVTNYDFKEQYYKLLGFTSAAEMGEAFVEDYENMIESIKKYGGFYIGRFELCGNKENPTIKKGENPIAYIGWGNSEINWYYLYGASRKFCNEVVTSTMIWGCQWDAMYKWTSKEGDKNTDSWNRDKHTSNYATAGNNDIDKSNNIYDLEGNLLEWTQEAYVYAGRAYRGGGWLTYQGNDTKYRSYGLPYYYREYSNNGNRLGTRMVLYIN